MLDILPVVIIHDGGQVNIHAARRLPVNPSLLPPAEETDGIPSVIGTRLPRTNVCGLCLPISGRTAHDSPSNARRHRPFLRAAVRQTAGLTPARIPARCPGMPLHQSPGAYGARQRLWPHFLLEKDARLLRLTAAGKMVLHLRQYRRRYLTRDFAKGQYNILRMFGGSQ